MHPISNTSNILKRVSLQESTFSHMYQCFSDLERQYIAYVIIKY